MVETSEERMNRIINKERSAKRNALRYFEKILAEDDKLFRFRLIDDETVEVMDVISGYTKQVNVACDNVAAVIYDIYKQAGDWIL